MKKYINRKILVILACIIGILTVFFLLNISTVNRLLYSNKLAQSPYTIGSQVQFKNPFDNRPASEKEAAVMRIIEKVPLLADGRLISTNELDDKTSGTISTKVIYEIIKLYKGESTSTELAVTYKGQFFPNENKDYVYFVQAYKWSDGSYYSWPEEGSFTDASSSKYIHEAVRDYYENH